MIELQVEKLNIGKISSNKTVHYLHLSKTKKEHINVAENYWRATCSFPHKLQWP